MKNLKKKKNFFLFTSSVTFCHINVCIVLNWRDFICIRRKRVKRLVKESSGAFIFPANEIFTFYELLKRLWIRYSWTVHIGDIDLRTSCSGRGSVNSEQKDNIHRVFEWKKKKKNYIDSQDIISIVSNWKLWKSSYPRRSVLILSWFSSFSSSGQYYFLLIIKFNDRHDENAICIYRRNFILFFSRLGKGIKKIMERSWKIF